MPSAPDPYFSVAARNVLIAGGAGGLGAPLARALSERGARIVVADVDEGRAQAFAAELKEAGGEARAVRLDVVDSASCAAAIDFVVRAYGRLDGLINASGIYRVAPALDLADSEWEQTLDVNVSGAFRLARAAGRVMVHQRQGSIVSLASVSSVVANPNYAAYAASKAAVTHMTRVLAVEWARYGVRVNAIGPAVTPTPLAAPILATEASRASVVARIPMGRFGSPDDLVAATIFLLSRGSSFVTGQTIYVDGGRCIS